MSGQPQGGSPPQHSLAFRVMRLCRPSFQAEDAVFRLLDPLDLLAPEDLLDDPTLPLDLLFDDAAGPDARVANSDFTFRDRFQIRSPVDAMSLSGLLVLPQSFGNIYLGETFSSYISVNNSSKFEARDVIIKAEIQTERQRILLLDTSKSPVESIRSGGRYDFIVEHDVKELGPHTLVCTALYNDGDSERKYLPQFFKFVVSNPLSVKTKVRTVKRTTQSQTFTWIKSNLNLHNNGLQRDWKLMNTLQKPTLRQAGGGIYNYLYLLKSTVESGRVRVDSSSILGKFQITWRTNLGEPGRLQTQQIYGTPIVHKDIDLHILDVPPIIVLERPFLVHLSLKNQTERTLGPFEIFTSPSISSEEKVAMVNGIQKLGR